jgi:glycosyltransferase involved in cell wall biosynthesis
LLPRVVPGLNWYFFNLCLRLKWRAISREDLLIVHYALHYPAVKRHPRVVVVSHGVEWEVPPRTWDDRVRAARALDTFGCCTVVANDTDYLRHCGVDIAPGQRAFEEVRPGRWYIPNCVDIRFFRKVAPDERLRRLNPILVPRNVFFRRGLHLAIEAFAGLAKTRHGHRNLVIVGGISDRRYYRDLGRMIERFGLRGRVHFWGHVPWAEMPAIYSAAECTVIPSIYSEGTSLSALESMACGTPVVSTDIGGLRDLPTLQCARNAAAMRGALVEVLSARDAYAKQQEWAVRERFNTDKWSCAWERVVDSVMARQQS